ncbi:uncharacterized protein LOC106013885 [Aplysia californica]|uniref:Uncharacterized protein LOC106013885 n=1 Tax=Aplysia californica TaxID=6500 RepID=A0ABM1AEI5_APLCA|nr:uncharacterized protein LOC106013885 [Aplysia californica]
MEASLTEEDFSTDEEEKETEESDEVLSISDLTVSEDSDEDDPRFLEGGRSGQLDFAREHGLVKEEQPSYEPGTSGVRTKPKSFLLPDPEDIQSSEEDVSLKSLEKTVAKIRSVLWKCRGLPLKTKCFLS